MNQQFKFIGYSKKDLNSDRATCILESKETMTYILDKSQNKREKKRKNKKLLQLTTKKKKT